jgi:multiple sugar transport system ATP-binding protein
VAAVSLEGVSKVFGGSIRAVDRLQLSVADRQLVVLVGPSGCGKTTTLRLIAGLEGVSAGVIRVGQRVVNRMPPRQRDVAMAFQQPALYPHLTVWGNLAFSFRMRWGGWWTRGRWRRLADRRVRQVARLLDIDQLLDRMPDQLSGGQQHRVALGRVLVRRPAAFLLDEPLSGLDPPRRNDLRQRVEQIARQLCTTMIYVTHDPADAMYLADRIVVMDRGTIQQAGEPRSVLQRPRNLMVARFFSQPQLNCMRGRWDWQADRLRFVGDDLVVPLAAAEASGLDVRAGRDVLMGVRPDDVRIAPGAEAGQPTVAGRVIRCRPWSADTLLEVAVAAAERSGDGLPAGGSTSERQRSWLVRAPGGSAPQAATGQPVHLQLAVSRLLWFDAQTGESLRP